MSMKIYNKLVRDNIPAVINETGSTCEIEVLDETVYFEKLNEKLKEELEEFYFARPEEVVGELADVIEVLYAIAESKGISVEDIEKVRKEKKEDRGGFKERIFLKTVRELE